MCGKRGMQMTVAEYLRTQSFSGKWVSIPDIELATGLCKRRVLSRLRLLEQLDSLEKKMDDNGTKYRLREFAHSDNST